MQPREIVNHGNFEGKIEIMNLPVNAIFYHFNWKNVMHVTHVEHSRSINFID